MYENIMMARFQLRCEERREGRYVGSGGTDVEGAQKIGDVAVPFVNLLTAGTPPPAGYSIYRRSSVVNRVHASGMAVASCVVRP